MKGYYVKENNLATADSIIASGVEMEPKESKFCCSIFATQV